MLGVEKLCKCLIINNRLLNDDAYRDAKKNLEEILTEYDVSIDEYLYVGAIIDKEIYTHKKEVNYNG